MATPSREGLDLSSFSRLVIDSSDVTGSWRRWKRAFSIEMEAKTLSVGAARFTPRGKMLAFLCAIGDEGREALTSLGFDDEEDGATYEAAIQTLDTHYMREDSVFVRNNRFFSASQNAGEDERDFLLRVERYSRSTDFIVSAIHGVANENLPIARSVAENVRHDLAVLVAVNGFRDPVLRKELMQKRELDWNKVRRTVTARSSAIDTEMALRGDRATGDMMVKQEPSVGEVRSCRTSRHSRKGSCGNDSLQKGTHRHGRRHARTSQVRFAPEWREMGSSSSSEESVSSHSGFSSGSSGSYRSDGKCYQCGKRGHFSTTCPSVQCFRCGRLGHMKDQCRYSKIDKSGRRSRSKSSCIRAVDSGVS